MAPPRLGINLWQFHRSSDMIAAAGIAGACGYAAVETVSEIPDPRALRSVLDAHRMECAARHVVLKDLAQLEELAASTLILKARHLVSSGLQVWDQRSAGDYRSACQALNRAGLLLRRQGIQLHYHHHDFEFAEVGGTTGLALLMEQRDPAAWDLCIDVGWVQQARHDPRAFLHQHRDSVSYVHLRDFTGADASCPLGQGVIDLPGIIQEVELNPRITRVMVEQEPSSDTAGDARASLEHVRSH